jgi:hypothetical protein
MKVGTPLGTYPLELRGVERRADGLALVGIVAGMESSLVIEPADLAKLAAAVAPLALVLLARRRSRRS